MWGLNYKHLHILFTMQVALFRVVWALYLLSVFVDAFLFELTLSISSIIAAIRRCSVATRKLPPNSMAIFVASRSGVQALCFIGQRHDPVDSCFDEVIKACKTLRV